MTSHCFTVNSETPFVSHCNAGIEATVHMLCNAVKWDERYWALGATGCEAARYRRDWSTNMAKFAEGKILAGPFAC